MRRIARFGHGGSVTTGGSTKSVGERVYVTVRASFVRRVPSPVPHRFWLDGFGSSCDL